MKNLMIIIAVLLSLNAFSQDKCEVRSTETVSEEKEDVNTPTPKELEDATIIVRTKDGKERKLTAKEFKVVKRKQQFKTKERVVIQRVECPPKIVTVKAKENKNLVMLGGRYDYTNLSSNVNANGNSAQLYSKRATILDLSYFRRNMFNSKFGAGLGIDTNGTPRIMGGFEF